MLDATSTAEAIEEQMPSDLVRQIKDAKLNDVLANHLLSRKDFEVVRELLKPQNESLLGELGSMLMEG